LNQIKLKNNESHFEKKSFIFVFAFVSVMKKKVL